jgi:hypothetical protein
MVKAGHVTVQLQALAGHRTEPVSQTAHAILQVQFPVMTVHPTSMLLVQEVMYVTQLLLQAGTSTETDTAMLQDVPH